MGIEEISINPKIDFILQVITAQYEIIEFLGNTIIKSLKTPIQPHLLQHASQQSPYVLRVLR